MPHLLRISGSYVNHSLQSKPFFSKKNPQALTIILFKKKTRTNFDDKITLVEKKKVVSKNEETSINTFIITLRN